MRSSLTAYRRSLPHPRLSARLDALSSKIPDPVNKLWFIKRTLAGIRGEARKPEAAPHRCAAFSSTTSALEALGELVWSPQPATVALPSGSAVRSTVFGTCFSSSPWRRRGLRRLPRRRLRLRQSATEGADWFFAKSSPSRVVERRRRPTYSPSGVGELPGEACGSWRTRTTRRSSGATVFAIVTTFEDLRRSEKLLSRSRKTTALAAGPEVGLSPWGSSTTRRQSDMAPLDA